MSALQDLAASLRAGSRQLPVDVTIAAADRLTVATELLAWVRRTSPHPLGVPQLAAAVDHLEHAVAALRAAQDAIDGYLAALGLAAAPAGQATGQVRRPEGVGDESQRPEAAPQQPVPLRRWWSERVDELTTDPDSGPAAAGTAGPADRGQQTRGSDAGDPVTLLRRVAARVRSDDRGALREDLRRVDAPVGLGLSAVSPAALRQLATDLLGRAPRPDDLERLRGLTGQRLRQLLPGVPATVPDTLLERVCQVPPDQRRLRREREQAAREREQAARERADGRPAGQGQRPEGAQQAEPVDHPADSAVAGAVLVGILAHRLGREPDAIGREDTAGPGSPHA